MTPTTTSPTGITIDGAARLHPATGRRLTCGCPHTIQTDDTNRNPLHLGRTTRRIHGRLARAVHHRDRGRCQAPGCTNRTTQIHHIRHWANGGPTCITNLISLCDSHHWLVHEERLDHHHPASRRLAIPLTRRPASSPKPRTAATVDPLPHQPDHPPQRRLRHPHRRKLRPRRRRRLARQNSRARLAVDDRKD